MSIFRFLFFRQFFSLKLIMTKKILMLCKGNICRSPIAEAVMQDIIIKSNLSNEWQVDSAGMTSEWEGQSPDTRSMNIMENHGLEYNNKARQIKNSDYNEFDYIFGMDEENMNFLKSHAPAGSKAKLFLLGDFGLPEIYRIIEDPYYDHDDRGFEKVYQQCLVACDVFLKKAIANEV